MRILIVDDEHLARDRLKRMLEEQSEHSVIGEAQNGQDALEKIESLHPDLVLLDIRMPGIDGLEVARHLIGIDEPPAVIFTTAYDEYALEAFKVNAVDYLLKPIRPEKLKEAVNKALKPNKLQWKLLNREKDGFSCRRTHISSRTRKGIILIPVEDIYYFRAEHKYLVVRYKGGEVLIEETLKDLESEFRGIVVRIHRNCLVARDYLQILEKGKEGQVFVRLSGIDEILEVSRRHLPQIRDIMAR